MEAFFVHFYYIRLSFLPSTMLDFKDHDRIGVKHNLPQL